jgi:hypothetical protein
MCSSVIQMFRSFEALEFAGDSGSINIWSLRDRSPLTENIPRQSCERLQDTLLK